MNTAIESETEREEKLRRQARGLRTVRHNSNLIFDGLDRFRWYRDKLDAHSDSPEAIADLAPGLDHNAGSRKLESQFQNRALRIFGSRVNEHAVRADVGRPDTDVFLEAFVDHGQFAELRMAYIPPGLRLVLFAVHD
jgi:hypothetical protein